MIAEERYRLSSQHPDLRLPNPAASDQISVQRFHLYDRGAVIASGPESGWRRRAVDVDAADVGRAWQQILGDLAGLRIDSRHRSVNIPPAQTSP